MRSINSFSSVWRNINPAWTLHTYFKSITSHVEIESAKPSLKIRADLLQILNKVSFQSKMEMLTSCLGKIFELLDARTMFIVRQTVPVAFCKTKSAQEKQTKPWSGMSAVFCDVIGQFTYAKKCYSRQDWKTPLLSRNSQSTHPCVEFGKRSCFIDALSDLQLRWKSKVQKL